MGILNGVPSAHTIAKSYFEIVRPRGNLKAFFYPRFSTGSVEHFLAMFSMTAYNKHDGY